MQLPQGHERARAVVPLEGAGSSFLFLLGESRCHGPIHPQIVPLLAFFEHTSKSPRNGGSILLERIKNIVSWVDD